MARKKAPLKDQKNPRLIKTETGVMNRHDVVFTLEEKEQLRRKVDTANRKRNRMLKEYSTLLRKHAGKPVGGYALDVKTMGHEGDFIIAKRSKSLHQFENREQFERYMRNLDMVTKHNYVNMRVSLYRKNFTDSLSEVYGDEATDIIKHINKMKPKDYMKMVEADETLEISYVPSDQKVQGRLNQIRQALGIPEKDEWADETVNVKE